MYSSWDLFAFLILIWWLGQFGGGVGEGVAGGWHSGTIKRASRFKISWGWHLWNGGGGDVTVFFTNSILTCRKKGLKEKIITLYTVSYAMKTRVRWHKENWNVLNNKNNILLKNRTYSISSQWKFKLAVFVFETHGH